MYLLGNGQIHLLFWQLALNIVCCLPIVGKKRYFLKENETVNKKIAKKNVISQVEWQNKKDINKTI